MRYVLPLIFGTLLGFAVEGQSAYIVRAESDMPEKGFHDATVVVHGSNIRASFRYAPDAGIPYTDVVSRDGGKTLIALNSRMQTWFRPDRSPFIVHSRLFSALQDRKRVRVRDLKAHVVEGESPTLLGRFSYETRDELAGHTVKSTYVVVAKVWADPAKPGDAWPAPMPFVTELPAIDAEVDRTMSLAKYFPRRVEVTITRQFVGGPPQSETTSFTVERLADSPAVTSGMFTVPPGYREQPPIVTAPGL